jgi:hypothetical protein
MKAIDSVNQHGFDDTRFDLSYIQTDLWHRNLKK